MMAKKSLYEILEILPAASYDEIRAAHQRQVALLDARQASLARDDYSLQATVLRVAFDTLSAPSSRDAYDAQLAMNASAAASVASASPMASSTARNSLAMSNALAVPADAATAALRADAMLLRAESLALRADAMGLKADLATGYPLSAREPSSIGAAAGRTGSVLRTTLFTLGAIAAMAIVIKLLMLWMVASEPAEGSAAQRMQAEKVYLQEYFQTYGVRPANRAEAEKLDAERRLKNDSQRSAEKVDEDKRKVVNAEKQFEEDARKRAAEVSADLERTEARAKQAQALDDEQKAFEKNMTALERAAAERRRVAADQEKWQKAMATPAKN